MLHYSTKSHFVTAIPRAHIANAAQDENSARYTNTDIICPNQEGVLILLLYFVLRSGNSMIPCMTFLSYLIDIVFQIILRRRQGHGIPVANHISGVINITKVYMKHLFNNQTKMEWTGFLGQSILEHAAADGRVSLLLEDRNAEPHSQTTRV